MVNLFLKIQMFLKSSFFIELCEIFSIIGIGIFILVLIVYPIFINLYNFNKEEHGRDIQ